MLLSEKNKYNITTTESRLLIVTSSLVCIPIFFAYQRCLYFHMITSTGTWFFSVLYWQNPVHGWRRNLDLIYAKYTFLVYLTSGIFFTPFGYPTLFIGVGAAAIAQAYIMTYIYPQIWIRFHVLFHLLCIGVKTYILSQIHTYYFKFIQIC